MNCKMSVPIPLIIAIVGILAAGIMIVLNGNKPVKEKKAAEEKRYKKMYQFFSNFFLTSGKISKITARISALSIYNRAEMQQLAIKYFLMSTGVSLGIIVAGIALYSDTVAILICVAFAVVINDILVTKQVDKVNIKVYYALKHTISAIRQEYLRLGSVPEAIAEADIHPLLRRPFDEIYQILTSANGELRLLKFYESSPFRSLQTFAGVCYNINNSGDDKDEYGQSNFVQALTMLNSDINSELERLTTMKTKFGVIEYLTMVPIFVMNFIESYFAGIMPGTALIYGGPIGYLCRTITLLACIGCYSIIANINSPASVKEDDRKPWIQNMLKNDSFHQFIYNISPKNAKRRRVERSLKNALSKKSVEHLYTEKFITAAAVLVIAIIATASIVSLGRQFTLTTTQQLSLTSDSSMDEYSKEDILSLDYAYLGRDHNWTDEEFQTYIKSAMPNLTDLQVQDQISRLKSKESSLEAAYFHWYYMIICIVICVISWWAPDALLMLRAFLVQTEAEDDFLQLQTLMAILMNMDLDTLDAIWQLCQNSRIHKDMLIYCYHSYPSNPDKELTRLQSKTPIIDFKRFIGKLKLTISDLSLAEAYSDLRIERDHMIRVREVAMYATIDKKRTFCGPISLVPIGCVVIGELLIPLGYLGIKEFMSALSSMNSL